MPLLWATDIHVDKLRVPGAIKAFGEYLAQDYPEPDTLLITGDISEAATLVDHLMQLAEGWGRRIAFLVGNHDFYGASIYGVNRELGMLEHPQLVWLDPADPILFDDFALVGRFSWYDAHCGDAMKSQVILHDWTDVEELAQVFNEYEWVYQVDRGSRHPLLTTLRRMAADSTAEAKIKLEAALQLHSNVVFATHVAPFRGASWHEGKISNDQWLPWFTCRQMGQMLAGVAAAHPDHKILVLCGHNHSAGTYQHAPNLRVLTGGARYGAPDAAGMILKETFAW
jgi:hypothetical protein